MRTTLFLYQEEQQVFVGIMYLLTAQSEQPGRQSMAESTFLSLESDFEAPILLLSFIKVLQLMLWSRMRLLLILLLIRLALICLR